MYSAKNKRRRYDAEFRRNAVEIASKPGRTVTQMAAELGVPKKTLMRWVGEFRQAEAAERAEVADPGRLRREMEELRRRLEKSERQRDILKKALAICSLDPDGKDGSS